MTYMTKQGDTWDLIAFAQLGSEVYMTDLIRANPDHADTVVFSAGAVLTLPGIEQGAAVSAELPPWKREG
ncbi:tail protein X [Paenibacillus xanthanilyticus]|uniref:Tail protein X n=1 Tax=Paenibacillus xanthanilyticus TaxID=1783531 RepID=A0ABV8KAE0_9BACL